MVAQLIRVRLCEQRDLEHFGPFGTPQHLAYCRDELRRGPEALAILLAVDSDDRPVGKLHLDFEERATDGAALLVAAAVLPALRGRGVGTELMREAEVYAAGRGMRAIELGVEDSNPGARRLYERLGYEAFAADNCVYQGAPSPTPGVWMRKQLAT